MRRADTKKGRATRGSRADKPTKMSAGQYQELLDARAACGKETGFPRLKAFCEKNSKPG